MNASKTLLSIVIPVYNEEKTIGTVLENLEKIKLHSIDREIIIVDDGSKDQSVRIIKEKIRKSKNIKLIEHPHNKGKGAAVVTGFANAKGDILLIQDADLEYNPKDIPKLLEPILKGKDKVVYGTRLRKNIVLTGNNKTPLPFHFFGNKFLSLVTSILYGESITDMETGYKVFKKSVLSGMHLNARSFDFEPEITAKILKKGIHILEIDIDTNPRGYAEGKKIRPVHDGVIALWTLIKYRFIK
ncbi:MAG: glycosyltransferase family 2 protein [Candidatus Levybacteria bacterium]|nr:glycosyltransferase family 2 protein [Candidatus Levybacteria bacterium]